MRAWARDNGYDVADRGRLRPEVLEAYEAAQSKGGATATKKAPAAKPARPAKKASPVKKASPARKAKPAPARKAAAKPVVTATAKKVAAPPAAAPEPTAPAATPDPEPKPKPVLDDRRLVALGEEIAALTERVAQLEKQLNGKSSSKASRFRRNK